MELSGVARMSEPEKEKRRFSAMFSRKDLFLLAISVLASAFLGAGLDLGFGQSPELSSARANAYVTIAQFAPWNIAVRYIGIVSTEGNADAERMAQQQHEQALEFRGFACSLRGNYAIGGFDSVDRDNPCTPPPEPDGLRAFYLSAHVPILLRFITAFFDLLLHALVDQGAIGFLVAAAQIVIGALLTRLAIRHRLGELDSFASYVFGVPIAIMALGSFGALPLWGVAFLGVTGLKAFPAAALGAQFGATGYFAKWIGTKTAEEVGHHVIMKQVERVLPD
jgi:hypothetical protein